MVELISNVVGDFTQSKKLFQTRCTVSGKVCSMVIEMGSSANLASTTMVEKLGLPTIPHPHPYTLLWFRRGNNLLVTKQVLVTLSIGKDYKDEVLCDVVPMEVCHLLLGTPWLCDRSVKYDLKENTYGFRLNGNNFTLISLLPPPPPVSQVPPPPPPLLQQEPPPPLPKHELPPPLSSPTPKPQLHIEENGGLFIELSKNDEVRDKKGRYKEDGDREVRVRMSSRGFLEWFSGEKLGMIVFKIGNYFRLRWENLKRVKMKGLGISSTNNFLCCFVVIF